MSNVYANPNELEAFAARLVEFLETIKDATNSLSNSFGNLKDSWQDEKSQAFEEEYGELLRVLAQFENSSMQKVEYIKILSSRLRDYLES